LYCFKIYICLKLYPYQYAIIGIDFAFCRLRAALPSATSQILPLHALICSIISGQAREQMSNSPMSVRIPRFSSPVFPLALSEAVHQLFMLTISLTDTTR